MCSTLNRVGTQAVVLRIILMDQESLWLGTILLTSLYVLSYPICYSMLFGLMRLNTETSRKLSNSWMTTSLDG